MQPRETREIRVKPELQVQQVPPVPQAQLVLPEPLVLTVFPSHGRTNLRRLPRILAFIGLISTLLTVALISTTATSGHFLQPRETRVKPEQREPRDLRVRPEQQVPPEPQAQPELQVPPEPQVLMVCRLSGSEALLKHR